MPKNISIHGSACEFSCEHHTVCYHRKKNEVPKGSFDINSIMKPTLNNDEYKIFVSVCSHVDYVGGIYLLNHTDNVTLTLPTSLYDDKQFRCLSCNCIDYKDRIQVTVTSDDDIKTIGNDIQKLFLIKDDETFMYAMELIKSERVSNIHFPIAQEYANISKIISIATLWKECSDETITIDSCLENFIVHGKCVYQDDYIDINYDGTYRKCPFKKDGTIIKDSDTIESMINTNDTVDCIYSIIFGG